MNQPDRVAENILGARARVDEEYNKLFSPEFKLILGKRMERVCKLLDTRVRPRSNDPQMIVHSIAEGGFQEGIYPTSKVEWDVFNKGDGNFIQVIIHARYKEMEDVSKTLVFPVGEIQFEEFCTHQETKVGEEKKVYTISDLMEAIEIALNIGRGVEDQVDVATWHFEKFGFHLPYNI